ncbi:MAG: phospholipase D family protein [Polyangiaceae bacterium]
MLVSTRNITFDQSWDTMLTLEGDVRGRTHRESVPLSDFVRHLPTLAVRELDARAQRDVELVAEEVRKIAFEMPEGVEALRFWPMGIDGYRAFPLAERADRRLIISPFLTKAQIAAFELRADDVLISRRDQLDRIPAELLAGVRACVINDAALPEDETEDDVDGPLFGARGLHAKLFVHDAGWQAHLWTGSANATAAGFHRNVEFLVQLTGKRSKLGVDAILGKGKGALEHLLTPHKTQAFDSDVEAAEEAMEAALESCVEAILAAEPNVRLSERGPDRFELVLDFARQLSLDGATVRAVRCWPVTLPYPRGVALPLSGVPRASFGEVSLGAVTSFFAFEARVLVGSTSGQRQFSLNLPIHGAPEDRFAKHLASLLKNDEGLLRFLLQLLATHEFDLSELEQGRRNRGRAGSAVAPSMEPIYELLVRSLHQNPERLKDVKRVLDELRGTPGAEQIVTPELDAVCAALFEAAGLETNDV